MIGAAVVIRNKVRREVHGNATFAATADFRYNS
jgi:hypothetical protein